MEEESDLALSSALPPCSGVSLALQSLSLWNSMSCWTTPPHGPSSPFSPKGGNGTPLLPLQAVPFIKAMALIPVVTVEGDHSSLKDDPDIIQRKENACWLVPISSTVLCILAPLLGIG